MQQENYIVQCLVLHSNADENTLNFSNQAHWIGRHSRVKKCPLEALCLGISMEVGLWNLDKMKDVLCAKKTLPRLVPNASVVKSDLGKNSVRTICSNKRNFGSNWTDRLKYIVYTYHTIAA